MDRTKFLNFGLSQAMILLISFISAYIPQYYFLFFIIFFIILTFIAARRMRMGSKPPPAKELGAPIFKEVNAIRVAMFDKKLMDETKKQLVYSTMQIVLLIPLIILIPFIRQFIVLKIIENIDLKNDFLRVFTINLLTFETIYVVMGAARLLLEYKVKPVNFLLPQIYSIYRNGAVLNETYFVKLGNEYCYETNEERKFVEIKNMHRKSFPIRLYTSSINVLVSSLREAGVTSCEQNRG